MEFNLKEGRVENTDNCKKNRWWSVIKIITIIIVTAIITYFCTITFTLKSYLNQSDITYLTTKISLINQKLNDTYIYDMNSEDMIEGAIKGYVTGVGDKYTQYLTKKDMDSFLESTTGSYVGIGVTMINNTSNNTIMIVGVVKDSVAETAGLQPGDIIAKVNDIEYTGEELDKVSAAIKGETGTDVKITIIRESQYIDYTITRSNIKLKSVGSKMLNNEIAYIEIASFNDGTASEFKTAYEELKNNNPKGLIIDLRNNGGGLVDESLNVAETMVAKGKTMLIAQDKNKKEKINKSKQNPIVDIPVVILINQNTASASEILAGCLRDNCNYKIVGTNSYGKGVIQSIFSFTDGSGIKVTIEEYFTPNHNVINKVGIIPDIEVKLDEKWDNATIIPYEDDLQLQKAEELLKQ